jgi:menaquinone-dependent protoporphyrinogen oxidase
MPAVKKALPAGDFRDWPEIEAWAAAIAHDLLREPRPEAG